MADETKLKAAGLGDDAIEEEEEIKTKLKAAELGDDAIEEEEEMKELRRRFSEILLERNEGEEIKELRRQFREKLLEWNSEVDDYKYSYLRWREITRIKLDKKDINWELLNDNQVIELVIMDLTADEILRKMNRIKEWSTRRVMYFKGDFVPLENPIEFVEFPPCSKPRRRIFNVANVRQWKDKHTPSQV